MLPPPFTGVGTLSHSSPCRCLFTPPPPPRGYYVREKLQLSNHNAQRACGRESQLLWTVAVTFWGLAATWLAHGIDISVGHGDRWTALVCVVQCARYPCYPSAAQRSWRVCCWVHHVIGVQIHDRIGGGLWRTIWLRTKIERFWFFVLVWKPFLLGTGTSATSNGKTSSPNMEKEKDVGQIIRKWQMFKTLTFLLKRPVSQSTCKKIRGTMQRCKELSMHYALCSETNYPGTIGTMRYAVLNHSLKNYKS